MRRFLDAHSGWTEHLVYDAEADRFHIDLTADVEPVIEANKRLLNDHDGYTPSRDLRKVAEIPLVAVEIYKRIWGADPLARGNEGLLKRMLNDPDLAAFRTSPGAGLKL